MFQPLTGSLKRKLATSTKNVVKRVEKEDISHVTAWAVNFDLLLHDKSGISLFEVRSQLEFCFFFCPFNFASYWTHLCYRREREREREREIGKIKKTLRLYGSSRMRGCWLFLVLCRGRNRSTGMRRCPDRQLLSALERGPLIYIHITI